MPNLSNITIIGHITREIEVKTLDSGVSLARFGVAVNTGYGDRQNTTFYNVSAWRKNAEFIGKYGFVGALVCVTGEFEVKKFERDNSMRYYPEINATTVALLSKREESQSTSSAADEIDLDDDDPFGDKR